MADTSSTHTLRINISATANTSQVKAADDAVKDLTKSSASQAEQQKTNGGAWKNFGAIASGALYAVGGGLKDMGGKMQGFANNHKALALGVVAGGIKMITATNDYNKTLKQTTLMSDDAALAQMSSADAMKYLDTTVEGLRGTFQTFSKQEIADQFYEIAKSGYSGKDATDLLSASLMLATATGEDVTTMTDTMVSTLTSFGLGADKSAASAQSLANAANASRMDVGDMLTALNLVGSQAAQSGLSLEETANIIGFLRQNGMNASTATTGLRTALSNLQNPTEGVQTVLDRLNMTAYDSEGNFRNFNEILQEYKSKTADATQEQKLLDAQLIAGKTGATAWSNMVKDSGLTLEEFNGKVKAGEQSIEEMQAEMNNVDTWGIFKANLADTALTLGEQLAPALNKALEFVNDFLTRLNEDEEFANNVANIMKAVAAFAIFAQAVGVIGGLLTGLGTIFNVLGGVVKLLTGGFGIISKVVGVASTIFQGLGAVLAFLVSPVGIVIAIIAALAAGFVFAYQKSEAFRDFVNGAVAKVKEFVAPAVEYLKEKFDWLGDAFDAVGKVFDSVGKVITGIWDGLKKVFKGGSDSGKQSMKDLETSTGTSTDNMSNKTKGNTKKIKDDVSQDFSAAANSASQDMAKMSSSVEAETSKAKNSSKANTGDMSADMAKSMKKAESDITQSTSNITIVINKSTNAWNTAFSNGFKSMGNTSTKIMNDLVNVITRGMNNIVNAANQGGRNSANAFNSGFSNIRSAENIANNASWNIQRAMNIDLYGSGRNAMISFGNGLASGLGHVYNMVNNASSAANSMSYAESIYDVNQEMNSGAMGFLGIPSALNNIGSRGTTKNAKPDTPKDGGGDKPPILITVVNEWTGEQVYSYVKQRDSNEYNKVKVVV